MISKDEKTLNELLADEFQLVHMNGNHQRKEDVSASVYGGGRHTWHLQLTYTFKCIRGQWLATYCVASTY